MKRPPSNVWLIVFVIQFVLCSCLMFSGCETGQSNVAGENAESTGGRKAEWNTASNASVHPVSEDALTVLFIGNSHSAPIPGALRSIFERQKPELEVHFQTPPGSGFLVDHLKKPATMDLLKNKRWDYVVLQAQKYSTSGKYSYPTDGAMELTELANQMGAKVIMYPEWSRRDHPEEYLRIRAIHDSIAQETGAVVAPIGEAWKLAAETSDCELYRRDGNHASPDGSYLNACVFYSMLMRESPELKREDDQVEDSAARRKLESAAWSVVQPIVAAGNVK